VVTDVGDSAWLVGDTGLVVSPRHPAALAEALCDLVRRESKGRRTLGLAARQRIAEGFSIAAISARFERLYENVLESSVARGGDRQCAA
jgi:glycosyltransferase involved in cell wall biosynthesis